MKVWEAIQMLEAMDQNKEVTVTFGKPVKNTEQHYTRDYVINKDQWVSPSAWPTRTNEITCATVQLQ